MLAASFNSMSSPLTPHFIKAGDAAHEGRNLLAGYNNAAAPCLLCADTMLAQVEGIGRDLCSLAHHNNDLTTQLKNAIKCISCAEQNLSMFQPDPRNESHLAKAAARTIELCAVATQALKEAGAQIARAVAAQAMSDFALPNEVVRYDPQEVVQKVTQRDFVQDALDEVDKSTMIEGPVSFQASSPTILTLAATGCNMAHHLQTQMAPFIRTAPFNETANKIIANAGNMENRFRAIQAKTKEHINACPTHPDPRGLANALKKETGGQIAKIRTADTVAVVEAAKMCTYSTGNNNDGTEQKLALEKVNTDLPNIEAINMALERCLEEMTKPIAVAA